jgi:predicted DCC family thiol-disulfide oxidoreductase YuxK
MAQLGEELPMPAELPDAQIVIWDGHCKFCYKQVRRLRWFDGGRLSYLSLHDPLTATLCPDLSFEQLMEQMWVVAPPGGDRPAQPVGGADAIRYLSRRLPRLWPIAPLMHLPFSMPLWRALYRFVAKSRYKIAGKCDEGGTCDLHR